MPDFVVQKRPPRQPRKHPLVNITPEAYADLGRMSKETGLSMARLVSMAVTFAAEHLKIETEEKKEDQ